MTLNSTLASTTSATTLVNAFDTSANTTTSLSLTAHTALNSLITITHATDTDSTYTIVGTDMYGNSQTESIAVTDTTATASTKVYKTVTSITQSGSGPSSI